MILGPAFSRDLTERYRDAVRAHPEARHVPWILQDLNLGPPIGSPEYFASVVKRVKEKLSTLDKAGKLNGQYDELETY